MQTDIEKIQEQINMAFADYKADILDERGYLIAVASIVMEKIRKDKVEMQTNLDRYKSWGL